MSNQSIIAVLRRTHISVTNFYIAGGQWGRINVEAVWSRDPYDR